MDRRSKYAMAAAMVALALVVSSIVLWEKRPWRMIVPPAPEELAFGVYDPSRQFSDVDTIAIEHVFVPWQISPSDLRQILQQAEARDRQLLVTVEPWTDAPDRVAGGEQLFPDILAGAYDGRIEAICREFAAADAPVLVRWGHEMEDVTGRYPWARNDAAGYRAAFQRFADTCRDVAPSALLVWSPKGEPTLNRYYPGDDYVDYVGLSVYTLEQWDLERYGKERTFRDAVAEKYNRVAKYGKPVIVAEFAIYGDKAYKDRFFSNFTRSLAEFPSLAALVYFNDKEPHIWPDGYGSPDWRVMADHFFRLTSAGVYAQTALGRRAVMGASEPKAADHGREASKRSHGWATTATSSGEPSR